MVDPEGTLPRSVEPLLTEWEAEAERSGPDLMEAIEGGLEDLIRSLMTQGTLPQSAEREVLKAVLRGRDGQIQELEAEREWLRVALEPQRKELEWLRETKEAQRTELEWLRETLESQARREPAQEAEAARIAWLEQTTATLEDKQAWLNQVVTDLSEQRAWLQTIVSGLAEERSWLESINEGLTKKRAWLEGLVEALEREVAWRNRERDESVAAPSKDGLRSVAKRIPRRLARSIISRLDSEGTD